MAKGRPPTPKHILQLRGSKHAKNREELGEVPAEPIEPPEWMKPRAKDVFRAVVGWLAGMGTVAESDAHVVARYATTYCLWEFAAQKLQEQDMGYVEVTAPDGSLRFVRPNGLMAQFKEAGEALRHLEAVLGLSPADRTRLGYGAVKVTHDPTDELFSRQAGGG
jgi:P27 family predicted phage terminase small subunit